MRKQRRHSVATIAQDLLRQCRLHHRSVLQPREVSRPRDEALCGRTGGKKKGPLYVCLSLSLLAYYNSASLVEEKSDGKTERQKDKTPTEPHSTSPHSTPAVLFGNVRH